MKLVPAAYGKHDIRIEIQAPRKGGKLRCIEVPVLVFRFRWQNIFHKLSNNATLCFVHPHCCNSPPPLIFLFYKSEMNFAEVLCPS